MLQVDEAVAAAQLAADDVEPPSVAFIEWPDPIYVGGHWTPQLIARAGGKHPLNPPEAPDRAAPKSFPVHAPEYNLNLILPNAPSGSLEYN